MTDLERAQQQGNQAAPDLLNAAISGELGGGSGFNPLKTDFIISLVELDSETNVEEILDAVKTVAPKLDYFEAADENEPEFYILLSDQIIAHIKSVSSQQLEARRLILSAEEFEIFEEYYEAFMSFIDTIEPNVLNIVSGADYIELDFSESVFSCIRQSINKVTTVSYVSLYSTSKFNPIGTNVYVLSDNLNVWNVINPDQLPEEVGLGNGNPYAIQYAKLNDSNEPVKLFDKPMLFMTPPSD